MSETVTDQLEWDCLAAFVAIGNPECGAMMMLTKPEWLPNEAKGPVLMLPCLDAAARLGFRPQLQFDGQVRGKWECQYWQPDPPCVFAGRGDTAWEAVRKASLAIMREHVPRYRPVEAREP